MDKPATPDCSTPPPKFLLAAEAVLFSSRWLILPITFGLISALLVYVYQFAIETAHLLYSAVVHPNNEDLVVQTLGLVDTAMVAFLVVMIAQGSHQIFVRRFSITDGASKPQWLDHIDSGILKVKISLSIAGITMVGLLKDFINVESVKWETTFHRIIIHLVCLVSAIAMGVIWRITHPAAKQVGASSH